MSIKGSAKWGKCAHSSCESPGKLLGYCRFHYHRYKKGIPLNRQLGRRNGVNIGNRGYIRVSVKGKKYLLHRAIAEGKLGRPLLTSEHVHHIDGDKLNNDPDNLQVLSPSSHAVLHNPKGKQARPPSPKAQCILCGTAAVAQQLCARHYQQVRRWL